MTYSNEKMHFLTFDRNISAKESVFPFVLPNREKCVYKRLAMNKNIHGG
jgi:hypothetical protein